MRAHGAALLVFTLLTLLLTWPTAFEAGSTLKDTGDPLLNTWILAWNAHRLTSGHLSGLLDANMFFPAPNTLAYSELLFSQSLVAAPVLLVSRNPVLAYNVALLVAMIVTAFGAYLLGAHLTTRAGGFVAGLIFGFSPFMVSHLSHLQVVTAGGIPLAFFFLHKFFASGRTGHLLLFTLCYVLQALANTYYAIYLTIFAGLFIAGHIVHRRRYADLRFWGQLLTHAAISLVTLGPFFYRYAALRRDLGFMVRRGESPVTAGSFLATTDLNWLYGDPTATAEAAEALLFPGFCALFLAVVGVVGMRALRVPLRHAGPSWVGPAYRTLGWLLLPLGAVALWVAAGGRVDMTLASVRVRATSLLNPLVFLALVALARLALKWRFRIARVGTFDIADPRVAYLALFAVAIFLTVPSGASSWLYRSVPGLDALRAVSRMHIMTMLVVAVLASYGMRSLTAWIGGRRGAIVSASLAAVILVEYVSAPLPVDAVPVKAGIPAVYTWLASQPEDFAFVEYPIVRRLQPWQVYFSSYHWKRSVTGASAFASPAYIALLRRQENVPSPSTLRDFEQIGVRYLVVHERPPSGAEAEPFEDPDVDVAEIDEALERLGPRLRFVAAFESYDSPQDSAAIVVGGRARVYQLTRSQWQSPRLLRGFPPRDGSRLVSDRSRWRVTASPLPELAEYAIDGDPKTRWHTRAQEPGDWLQLDLGAPTAVAGLVLHATSHRWDYPRGYRIDVSPDGEHWSPVAEVPRYNPPLVEFLRPGGLELELTFEPVTTRFVRIEQTAFHEVFWWTVSEIDVRQAPPASP